MKLGFILIPLLSFALLTGFFGGGKQTVELNTPSAFSTEAWLYKGKQSSRDTGIVFLHGKRGNPGSDHSKKFINSMKKMGYDVIAPFMPWSKKRGYDGTRQHANEVIDDAVRALGKQRVVVIGHSMGGMATIHYGTRSLPAEVIGLISVAPGHDPHQSRKIRNITGEDAEAACALVAEGKGEQRNQYPELNTGERYKINATARYYCSFYNISEFPGMLDIANDIKAPLFIVSGAKDRITQVYSHKQIFDFLPDNEHNNYQELPGNHKSVLFKNSEAIADWIESL